MKLQLLFLLVFSLGVKAQTFDKETILSSGTDESRINIVILPDGYTASEMTQFISDANELSNALFQESPYKEYIDFFNVYAIKVPSNESGASHPGTATDVTEPAHPVSTVDNYFGSTFDYYNIHRLLVATNSTAIYSVLANNFPNYDQVLILINTSYYGGSGGSFAATSLHSSAKEIAIHEMGHSFTGLIDEYYAGDVYAREGINMTQNTDPLTVKWKNWHGDNGIGIYQHCCNGNSASWYRPHQDCKMRYLGSPFCSVCTEGTVEEIHSRVSPVLTYSPESNDPLDFVNGMTFQVDKIQTTINSVNTNWFLNGALLAENVSQINLDDTNLVAEINTLTAVTEDLNDFLRLDNHNSNHIHTISWQVDASSLSISSISEQRFQFQLTPNPASEVITLNLNSENINSYSVKIFDLNGKLMYRKKKITPLNPHKILVDKWSSGSYFIKIVLDDNTHFEKQFVID